MAGLASQQQDFVRLQLFPTVSLPTRRLPPVNATTTSLSFASSAAAADISFLILRLMFF